MRPRPKHRKQTDDALRLPVRRALLGDRALPSPRWWRVNAGECRPLGILPELREDAAVVGDIPTALRRIADEIEKDERRAA